MNYSTKELTLSLQRIAEDERSGKQDAEQMVVPTFACANLRLQASADSFLEERREFRERTKELSFGTY